MKYLFGASGHAKAVVDILCSLTKIEISGIFDDDENIKGFLDIPFLGRYDKKLNTNNNDEFLISIGNNKNRKYVTTLLMGKYFNAISSKSYVSKTAVLGVGNAIMPFAVVNAYAAIGDHCIINTSAIIEHDCKIMDFVHISPGAIVTGNVEVGEGSHIGTGAKIIPNIKIGKWSVIGAGSVILKDVPDYAVVVGNPGRIVKFNLPEINEN